MNDHNAALSRAFDAQADQFEKAPVQSDPRALEHLVNFTDLPPGSRILDAGCGPGLVAQAFLEAGHRVLGVDLSAEMIDRAQRRCAAYGARARFIQGSLYDDVPDGPFDAAVSRYVLHHVQSPHRFIRRQIELLRPGGTLVLVDHTTDPDPDRAAWHQEIERLRDRTHTSNLSPGALVDLLAGAGLAPIQLTEEPFSLDFDEWFDRGTPAADKPSVRERTLKGPGARGWAPSLAPNGAIQIACWRALARGMKVGPEIETIR